MYPGRPQYFQWPRILGIMGPWLHSDLIIFRSQLSSLCSSWAHLCLMVLVQAHFKGAVELLLLFFSVYLYGIYQHLICTHVLGSSYPLQYLFYQLCVPSWRHSPWRPPWPGGPLAITACSQPHAGVSSPLVECPCFWYPLSWFTASFCVFAPPVVSRQTVREKL